MSRGGACQMGRWHLRICWRSPLTLWEVLQRVEKWRGDVSAGIGCSACPGMMSAV